MAVAEHASTIRIKCGGGVRELPAEGLSPRPVFVGHVAGDASKGRLAPKPWLVGHVAAPDPPRAEC